MFILLFITHIRHSRGFLWSHLDRTSVIGVSRFFIFYSPQTVSLRPTVSHDVSHRFLNGGCRQSENVSIRLTKVLKIAICPFRGSPLTTSEVQMWYKNRLKKEIQRLSSMNLEINKALIMSALCDD